MPDTGSLCEDAMNERVLGFAIGAPSEARRRFLHLVVLDNESRLRPECVPKRQEELEFRALGNQLNGDVCFIAGWYQHAQLSGPEGSRLLCEPKSLYLGTGFAEDSRINQRQNVKVALRDGARYGRRTHVLHLQTRNGTQESFCNKRKCGRSTRLVFGWGGEGAWRRESTTRCDSS